MISSDHVDSTWELTRKLTEDCFPRLTGMDGCVKAGNIIEEELDYCDKVITQPFSHRPRGFLKFLPFSAAIHFIALILYLSYPLISLFIFTLNASIFISQLLFYWGFFDFPFKKEQGINYIGTIEPEDEVKQQIVFSGHYDAPYVFQLIEKVPKYYPLIFGIALGTILSSLVFWLFYLFSWNAMIFFILICVLSTTVLTFFFFTTSEISPGAGDNAIAVGLNVELGKIIKGRMKNTRVIILALDAEEAGLNGARAYVNEYRDFLHSIPTFNFNIDSIYEKEHLRVFTRDLNSIRKLSKKEADIIQQISKDFGQEIFTSAMPLGGGSTDSAEFSRIGIDSIAFVGLNLSELEKSSYHTSRDTMNALRRDSIEFSLQIMEEYCLRKDTSIQ